MCRMFTHPTHILWSHNEENIQLIKNIEILNEKKHKNIFGLKIATSLLRQQKVWEIQHRKNIHYKCFFFGCLLKGKLKVKKR